MKKTDSEKYVDKFLEKDKFWKCYKTTHDFKGNAREKINCKHRLKTKCDCHCHKEGQTKYKTEVTG